MKSSIKTKYYKNERDFKRGLIESDFFSADEIKDSCKHERAHFKAAIKLGYTPEYGLEIKIENPGSTDSTTYIEGFISLTNEQNLILEDWRKIILAPKQPSVDDYKMLEDIENEARAKRRGRK